MKKNNLVVLLTLVTAASLLIFILYKWNPNRRTDSEKMEPNSKITNFEECSEAGNPIMESYPEKCVADGRTFIRNIGNELEKSDLIQVSSPRPNANVSSPLIIEGQARGVWFFEANFPVKLTASDGQELASGYAEAQGEWMTENFVPFKATISFTSPGSDSGNIILEKANPSGLTENDDRLVIPVYFSSN